jgi:hypothetical protein
MSPFLPANVLFPALLDNTTSIPLAIDNVVSINANAFNTLRQAIIAIEGELGVKPSGIYGTVKSRLNTYDTLFNIQGDPTNSATLGPAQDGYILTWDGYAFIPSPALSGSFSAGGDLTGSDTNQTVIGIQGVLVSSGAPTTGQVLTAISGTSANWQTPAPGSSFTAGGDLFGTNTSQTVIGIDGYSITPLSDGYLFYSGTGLSWKTITIPSTFTLGGDVQGNSSANTLVNIDGYTLPNPGNHIGVLQSSGSALMWGTVNLSTQTSSTISLTMQVSGVLPTANQAAQTMGGDVSGTTASAVVIALQGNSVASQVLDSNDDGYVLAWDNSDAYWKATKLDAGLELFSGGTPVETTNNLGVDGYSIVLNTVSGVPTLSAISSGSNATELQGVPVSSATPTDGYVLSYNGSEWLAVPQTGGGGGSSFGITYPAPPISSSYTALGNIGAIQSGSNIIVKTVDDGLVGGRELLLPLPGGVSGSGPFVAVMVAACQFNYSSQYPGFALVITNGDTGGTSSELWNGVYQNTNQPCLGVWEATLQSSARGTVYLGDNTPHYSWPMQQLYFRIINDGVNIIFQYSNMGGYNWRTSYSNTISSLGLGTITNYGISMGAYVGTGWGAAVITALNMAVQPQLTISSISSASSTYVVQTTTPHGLSIGDDVSITGVPGGSAANQVYVGGAVQSITSANIFVLASGVSISPETSGFVTILSQ